MTFGCRAARSAAPYGGAFGALFWPSDVDYAGLPSLITLIGRFKGSGSGRSGSQHRDLSIPIPKQASRVNHAIDCDF
eukprot:6212536-Prymnesium_polylepis.1